MPIVVVEFERTDAGTRSGLDWPKAATAGGSMLSAISSNGRRALQVFDEADLPELEASGTRAKWHAFAHRYVGGPPEALPKPGEATLGIVYRVFEAPLPEEIPALERAGWSCLTMHRVRYIVSFIAVDRRREVCLFAAPDLEAIRVSNRMVAPFREVMQATAQGLAGLDAGRSRASIASGRWQHEGGTHGGGGR